MCGRFSITADKKEIEERFHAKFQADWKPNYNVAPTQLVPIVTNENPTQIVMARFGFIPSWAKDEKVGYKMINARAETIMEKPTFKRPLATHRCLVIADGFYEWKATTNGKQPFRIEVKKGALFAMAGIWNMYNGVHTFAIITTGANPIMQPIHERMPVILPTAKEQAWLTTAQPSTFLKPFAGKTMTTYKVSDAVNSVRHNGKELLNPVT